MQTTQERMGSDRVVFRVRFGIDVEKPPQEVAEITVLRSDIVVECFIRCSRDIRSRADLVLKTMVHARNVNFAFAGQPAFICPT